MRLLIAAVGRLKQGAERDLFAHYLKRADEAGRRLSLGPCSVIELPESRAKTAQARATAEAAALLAKLPSSYQLICLHGEGDQLSSEAFAQSLRRRRDQGVAGVGFFIGGADGLGEQARAKASMLLSLGALTLPHGLARIVLAEQLYRAATIIAGHPYHRG